MPLLKPDLSMKEAFEDYLRDWEEHRETVAPAAARLNGRTYENWLEDLRRLETQPTDTLVTATTYFWFDGDGKLAGATTLRHTLTDALLRTGGNIGYGVRPSMRRLGYASAMLAAVLPLARRRGLTRVLITCNRENTASARTILRNGGVLENEITQDGRTMQRYWIAL
jgi:predicted acetyltransferase